MGLRGTADQSKLNSSQPWRGVVDPSGSSAEPNLPASPKFVKKNVPSVVYDRDPWTGLEGRDVAYTAGALRGGHTSDRSFLSSNLGDVEL